VNVRFSFFPPKSDLLGLNSYQILVPHTSFPRRVPFFSFLFSSSPTAFHMVSLTNPLRNIKRTYLSLSRFMAVSRGILIYS